MKVIATFLAFIFAPVAFAGDFIVYSGSCADWAVAVTSAPVAKKAFAVFEIPADPAVTSGTVSILVYGKKNGLKLYETVTYPMRIAVVTRPDSKRVGLFPWQMS